MAISNMEQIQNVMQSSTLRDDARLMQPPSDASAPPMPMPPMPMPPMPMPPMSPQGASGPPQSAGMPMPMPMPGAMPTLNAFLTEPKANGKSIQQEALDVLADKAGIETSKGLPMTLPPYLETRTAAETGGGLMNLMMRDLFSGQVPGQGHGMEDNVYMPIVQRQEGSQVGTLAVSPDEYVVDAHTMSALGNGSADAGANVMDQVVQGVREKAYGTTQQPNEINGLAALRPMLERV